MVHFYDQTVYISCERVCSSVKVEKKSLARGVGQDAAFYPGEKQ